MDFNPVLIWFLVGLALILSEFMVPGVILVFFGMGAWITAIGAWVGFAPDTSSQLLIFAISSVILLVLLLLLMLLQHQCRLEIAQRVLPIGLQTQTLAQQGRGRVGLPLGQQGHHEMRALDAGIGGATADRYPTVGRGDIGQCPGELVPGGHRGQPG